MIFGSCGSFSSRWHEDAGGANGTNGTNGTSGANGSSGAGETGGRGRARAVGNSRRAQADVPSATPKPRVARPTEETCCQIRIL